MAKTRLQYSIGLLLEKLNLQELARKLSPYLNLTGGGGTGDMTKATYDTNDDSRVDAADNATTIGASGYTIGTLTDTEFLVMSGTQITSQASAPGGYTDEQAQDAVGAMIVDTATIDLTYTDATPELKADIKAASVTEAMQVLADNTTNDVSTSKHGYVPKAPNDTTKFLRGDATWAVLSIFLIYTLAVAGEVPVARTIVSGLSYTAACAAT